MKCYFSQELFIIGSWNFFADNLWKFWLCLLIVHFYQELFIVIIMMNVLLKGRYFIVNSGTKAAVLPKGRSSTANSGTKVAVLLGMNRCGSFLLLSAPYTLLHLNRSLKIWKDPRGPSVEVRRVDLTNWALRTSQKFTTGVKYQFQQGFWPDHPSPESNVWSTVLKSENSGN